MPDRIERALRILSYGLAAVVLIQVVLLMTRRNPLAGLRVPQTPRWVEPGDRQASNAPASGPSRPPASAPGPTAPLQESKTATGTPSAAGASNASPSTVGMSTNGVGTSVASQTNAPGQPSTNRPGTQPSSAPGTVVGITNATAPGATNPTMGPPPAPGAVAGARPLGVGGPLPGGPGGSGRRSLRPPPPFASVIQARIDRVTSSEMLAPVVRPPPMALMGIAGHHAFIRTPSGQTSMLREGGESDGIRLIRLGTNRVLIEQAGEKKELIIFNGLGSASLLTP